jgi:hypothetical protein
MESMLDNVLARMEDMELKIILLLNIGFIFQLHH